MINNKKYSRFLELDGLTDEQIMQLVSAYVDLRRPYLTKRRYFRSSRKTFKISTRKP